MEHSHSAKPTQSPRRVLLGVILVYVVYYGLTILSRFIQPMSYLVYLTGIAFPLVSARAAGDWTAIGFTRRNWKQALLWGTATGLALLLLVYIGAKTLGTQSTAEAIRGQLLIGIPLSFMVISPFQEFLFRGWMQPRLQKAMGKVSGLLACSLLFAAWDTLPPLQGTSLWAAIRTSIQLVPLSFAFGCVVGYVFQRTGNMLAPWLAHSLAVVGLILSGRLALVS